jgi:dihydroorotate dehydrogenase
MMIIEKEGKISTNGHFTIPLDQVLRDFSRALELGQLVDDTERRSIFTYLASYFFGSKIEREARQWLKIHYRKKLPQDKDDLERLRYELIRFCTQGQLTQLLASYRIPHPTYNYFKPFLKNVDGPWDVTVPFRDELAPAHWSILGFKVGFPIGVSASALTATSSWISYYAHRNFNIITYKTVRSRVHDAHPYPNWVFLKGAEEPFIPEKMPPYVEGDGSTWPNNPRYFSTANSFGVPSFEPGIWKQDIKRALKALRNNQLLIVSVMGSPEVYAGDELADDFVKVAQLAEEAGARVIELNLSCPNTFAPDSDKSEGHLICDSPETTRHIVAKVHEALDRNTKLIIKLSYMPREKLEQIVVPLASLGQIDGVSGINTISMEIRRPDANNKLTFVGAGRSKNSNRARAGVSGVAIREFGLQFVRWLSDIRRQHNLRFHIIGMGGVMNADDVNAYLQAGAQAVQTATAAFFNPSLAQEVYNHWLETGALRAQATESSAVEETQPISPYEFSRQVIDLLGQVEPDEKENALDTLSRNIYPEGYFDSNGSTPMESDVYSRPEQHLQKSAGSSEEADGLLADSDYQSPDILEEGESSTSSSSPEAVLRAVYQAHINQLRTLAQRDDLPSLVSREELLRKLEAVQHEYREWDEEHDARTAQPI